MYIENNIEIKCLKCGTVNVIEPSDFEDIDRISEDRSMGIEISVYWKHEIECSKCHNHIVVEISAFEYPLGFLNFVDKESTGGEVINEPKIVLIDE